MKNMNFCICFKKKNYQDFVQPEIELDSAPENVSIEEANDEETLENALISIENELKKVDFDQIEELDNLNLEDSVFSIKYPKMHKYLLDLDELASTQSTPNEPCNLKYQRSIKLLKSFYDLKLKPVVKSRVPKVIDVITNKNETLNYLEELVDEVQRELIASELAVGKSDKLLSKIDKLISVIEEVKLTIPRGEFYELENNRIDTFNVSQLGNDLRLFKYDKKDKSEDYFSKFNRLNPYICIDLNDGSNLKKLFHRLKEFFSPHSYLTLETKNRFFDLVRNQAKNGPNIPLEEIQIKVCDAAAKEIFFGSIILSLFDYKLLSAYSLVYNIKFYVALKKKDANAQYLFKLVEKKPTTHHGESPQVLYRKFSNEKNIHLIANKSVFFAKLLASFQTRFCLVLAIQIDNAYLLEDRIVNLYNLEPDVIKTYSFKLLSAINFLHQHGIIHRDIKATNVLVDEKRGFCKILDLKFSKIMEPNEKTYSTLGDYTWYYDAPEMYASEGYSFSIDYWSLGVLIYRMIFKDFPFKDLENQLKNPVFELLETIDFDAISRILDSHLDVLHLLKHLLKRNPDERVPITSKPVNYKMTDEVWNALINGTYVPKDSIDFSEILHLGKYVDFSFENQNDDRSLNEWYTMEPKDEFEKYEHYEGFTYINSEIF